MDVTFLGTGAGVPAKNRNVSAIALTLPEYKGDTWLFDCGEATQHQILYTSLKLSKISNIFITHLHGDHIFGLPGVLGSRSFQGSEDPLNIYGPPGIKAFIEAALCTSSTYLKYPMTIFELNEDGHIFEDEHFQVVAGKLDHGVACFGFRVIEKDQPGELLVKKLKADGVQPGPVYRKIKENPYVTLPGGRRLTSDHYLGPKKAGRKVTILGDTRTCQAAFDLAKDADLLIHEATFSREMGDKAKAYGHSTSVQAAETAKAAEAAALILTHISSRYQGDDDMLLDEAKAVFPNSFLARDLWTYQLNRQPR
ncbi:RNAse Z [Scopulibacillus darangshiensis]|uniref:Ribonuclease Z n=1 Tax=Scopulibacillus darangshiensis TaxID=442528 RepID=A0A4R2PCI4_9BACL|nr:ribonuclease Z [Scopulibacillus darangshiensis]TCP31791.1 RNAse Z [Scopulibacillus darangshiensis]